MVKQPDSDIAQNRKYPINLKRQNVFVKRRKKNNYSCRTIFTPTNTVEDDGTECLFFCMKLDFSTFFTDFSSQRFLCTIASILKQKTLQRFCFSFGEIWFSDWVRLFLHQYRKILPALFCGISAEITAFR